MKSPLQHKRVAQGISVSLGFMWWAIGILFVFLVPENRLGVALIVYSGFSGLLIAKWLLEKAGEIPD